MPIIQLENGDKLQFDDNYTDEQIGEAVDHYVTSQPKPQEQPQASNQPSSPISKTESAITGFGQGTTANFGDEILAGVSAPVIYGGSRLAEKMGYNTNGLAQKSLAETYRGEQLKNQQGVRDAEKANPKSYLAGNIAGNVATAAKIAPTKAGNMTAQSLRTGSLPVRALKAAPVGFATSALSGAGVADHDKIGQTALKDGKTGAAISTALPFVGATLGKVIGKSDPIPTSGNITNLSRQAYKEAEERGGILKNSVVDKFVDDVQGMTPQTEMGKILAGDDPFTKLAGKIEKFRGKVASLQSAQEIDEILSDQIDGFVDKTTGKVTAEGLKIQKVQDAFRKGIESASEADVIGGKEGFDALKKGRGLWANAARLRDVERIITRAEMTDNPATAIKTGFRNLYNNPSRLRGFNESERKLIKKAAESGVIGDTLRTLGSRLIPIGSVVSGGGLTGTAASQAATMAARGASTKLQVGRAQDLARAVANRSIPNSSKQLPRYPLLNPAIAASLSTQNNY